MQVSNYATDVFTPIFAAIRAVSGAEPYTDKVRACQALGVYWQHHSMTSGLKEPHRHNGGEFVHDEFDRRLEPQLRRWLRRAGR